MPKLKTNFQLHNAQVIMIAIIFHLMFVI